MEINFNWNSKEGFYFDTSKQNLLNTTAPVAEAQYNANLRVPSKWTRNHG